MKKFFKHIILFFLLPLCLVFVFFNTKFALFLNESKDVHELIAIAELGGIKTNTLLLGDSVCRQLFGKKKDKNTYCLCENQSYEVPGNYLLLKSLLEKKSSFKNLVLMINPLTLVSSLNQNYTYNYFVKPFRNHLDDLDLQEIKYIDTTFPKDGLLKYKFSNFELPNSFNIPKDGAIDSLGISAINLKYLRKMDSVCEAHHIDFKIISPPLPSNNKKYIQKFTHKTKELLAGYFESIIFYDSRNSKDGLHHKDPDSYIKKNSKELDALLKF